MVISAHSRTQEVHTKTAVAKAITTEATRGSRYTKAVNLTTAALMSCKQRALKSEENEITVNVEIIVAIA